MRSWLVGVLVLGVVALTAVPVRAQPRGFRRGEQPAAQHGWLSSLEQAKTQARQTGKPLMVVVRCVP